jgi:hypothetical protein
MNLFFFCLFYLFLNISYHFTITTAENDDCSDPLACYLSSLEFEFPDITLEVNGETFSLTNTICHGIDITAMPSSYDWKTSLSLGMEDLGTSCVGNYAYGKLIRGQVSIAIVDTDAFMTLFTRKEKNYPVSVRLTDCSLDNIGINIDFSNPLLDIVSPVLAKAIEELLDKTLCLELNKLLINNVTEALVTKINPKIAEIVASQPDAYPIYGKNYLNWNSSFVQKIHDLIDKMEGLSSLPDFLRCMAEEDIPLSTSSASTDSTTSLLSLFSSSSSAASSEPNVPRNKKIKKKPWTASYQKYFASIFQSHFIDFTTWKYNPLTLKTENAVITVESVTIKGSNTLNNLEILEPLPESKVTLRTAIGMDYMELDMKVLIELTGTNNDGKPTSYTQETMLMVNVTDISFLMDLVIATNEHILDSYNLDQLSSVGCWLYPINEISIPKLAIDLTSAKIMISQIQGDSGQLEADLVNLFNNIFLYLLTPGGYETLSIETLIGLFEGPLRISLNEHISSVLNDAKTKNPCLAHYPYDDVTDYINWPESTVITMLNTVINEIFSYEGLNKLMSCGTDGTGAVTINTNHLAIQLSGLNSFYGLEFLLPYNRDEIDKQYHLSSYMAMGYCPNETDNTTCNPLTITITASSKDLLQHVLLLSSDSSSSLGNNQDRWSRYLSSSLLSAMSSSSSSSLSSISDLAANFKLVMTFENFYLNVETLTMLNMNALKQLTHGQLGVTGCYATSLDTLQFELVNLNLTKAVLYYQDGTGSREITYGVSALLNFLTKQETINAKNNEIAVTLSNADKTCANGGVNPDAVPTDGTDTSSGSDNNDNIDWTWQLFILITGSVASLIALLAAYNYWGREKKIACLSFVKGEVNDDYGVVTHDDRSLWERLDFQNALVFHKEVPLWLRIAMPVAICTAIALFADSNSEPAAVEVMLKIHIGEETIDLGSIFQFGLENTVHDVSRGICFFIFDHYSNFFVLVLFLFPFFFLYLFICLFS